MRKHIARVVLAGILGVLGCASGDDEPIEVDTTAENAAPACAPAAENQAEVTASFLRVLFPDSAADAPIACRITSAGCAQRFTHRSAPPSGPVPAISGCRSGAQPLDTCYTAAVQVTLAALNAGDAAKVFEGAVRTRDVTLRAANDDSSPLWLRTFGNANLLARTFIDAGVPVDAPLADCTTGTADQRYACLAMGNRAHFRGLLALLDRHLGILLRTGTANDLVGASERVWNIVKSATAPMHARMVASGKVDPKAGIRMNRVDLLGKYAVMRQLDGSTVGTVETHLADLVTKPTYTPAAPGEAGGLFVPRFDIVLAAGASFGWDDAQNRPIVVDPIGVRDLSELHRTLTDGIALATLQGQCLRAQEYQDVRFAIGALYGPRKFEMIASPIDLATFLTMDSTLHDVLVDTAITRGRSCGWITSEDYVYGWTTNDYEYETDSWMECELGDATSNGGVVTDCERCESGDEVDGIDCECHWHTYGTGSQEYSFEDCGYIVEIQYQTGTTYHEYRVADAYTWVTSIRGAYRDLMAYNDAFEEVNGAYVKRSGGSADGILDLHHNPVVGDDATIALAYVDGDACDAEVSSVESTLGTVPPLDCESGDICGDTGSALFPPGPWYPFPIAARLCPVTAGTFAGILADDGHESWCVTPWDFTKAVAHQWLPYANDIIAAIGEEDLLDGIVTAGPTWQAEDGEDLESVLVEFFAEANLHGTPTGAAYLRKAQVAYSAGKLPTLDADANLAGETLGLDNVEANVDTGLEVMGLDFELLLDYHAYENDPSATSTPYSLYYDRPIPKLALAAMEELDGGIVTNDYTSTKAMIYPRLGDALELYRQLARMKLEILWRRADGFNACIDTGVCDPAGGTGCATYCGYYEDVLAFVDATTETLDGIDAMLADHAAWMTHDCPFTISASAAKAVTGGLMECSEDPQGLHTYIVRLRDHIAGTKDELARSAASMQAGNDAFGFRGTDHYPGDGIDARIVELVDGVRLMGTEYEGFVDDYLATLADHNDFESAVASAATNTSQLLASYCVDPVGIEAPTACAVDDATWTTSTALVAVVNAGIADTFCAGTVVDRDTGVAIDFMPAHLAENGQEDMAQIFGDYMTSIGLTKDTCPQLVAPDFAAWDGYGGVLADDLGAMQTVLEQVATLVARFRTELYSQTTMAEAVAVIQAGIDGGTDAAAQAASLQASMGCITAAMAAVATEGVAVPGAMGACTNMLFTIAGGVLADSIEELRTQLDTLFFGYSSLQNLMAIAADVNAAILSYDAAVRSFDAHRAQLQNALNNVTADYRDLFENAFAFDPTNLLFADEQVANMVLRFDDAMRDVRELEILVGYDLGAPLAEDKAIYLEDGYYYLPRLADVTVAESYGATGLKAYRQLAGSTRPLDERDISLVGIATLLGAIHDTAQLLSGELALNGENYSHGFLSTMDSSGFDAAGYPESYSEWMLLRRSPFYNAWIASDPSSDDDRDGVAGTACGVGQVDLYYYCDVPENTCLTVTALPELTRLNLAWADMEIVGIGAHNFTCTNTGGVYTIAPATGANGVYLDIEELNPTEVRSGPSDFDFYLPDFMENGTLGAGDSWYRGISQAFYDAQTPTVKTLMSAVLDMADRGVVQLTAKTFMPGSYLLGLQSSDSENPNATYDPVVNDFDLEGWGLIDTPVANSTFAERLKDISIFCMDSSTCQGNDRNGGSSVESHYARFFYSGPGQQSTVCVGPVNQQKSQWMIDDRTTEGEFAIRSTNTALHLSDAEWMTSRAGDPSLTVRAGQLDEAPLQSALAVIQVLGLTDAEGVAEPQPWVLQGETVADDIPNLRVAFHYRYYRTELGTNAQWDEDEGHNFYESVTSCTGENTYPW